MLHTCLGERYSSKFSFKEKVQMPENMLPHCDLVDSVLRTLTALRLLQLQLDTCQ